MIRLHATCVSIHGSAVLLRGPSGAGKSDLALRLIDGGGCLVADDQVELSLAQAAGDAVLIARPPSILAGLLEVRGIGIVRQDYLAEARVRLVLDLVAADHVERMPEAEWWEWNGIRIPLMRLDPFAASAPAKVRLAVGVATQAILCVQ